MRNWIVAVAAFTVLSPASVTAQERPADSFVPHIVKGVFFDPTTYAPGIITYGSMRLDWESSQVFFRHGYVEQNGRYTVSGVNNSVSIAQRAGNLRIARDSVGVLQLSLAHNLTQRIIERELTRRYPTHGKFIRVIGRIERIAAASYLSIALSSAHFRQWRKNERLARELGY